MKPKTTLFELINSLNKVEAKRVVNQLNSFDTEHSKLQLELFKAVRASRTTDPEVVFRKISSPSLREYVSFHKGNLMGIVLDVLASNSPQHEMSTLRDTLNKLDRIHVLRDRGFESEAVRDITQLAEEIDVDDAPHLKLLVLRDKYRFIKSTTSIERGMLLDRVHAEQSALFKIISNEIAMESLNDKAYELYQTFRESKHAAVSSAVKRFSSELLLKSEENALSFSARLNFNKTHVFLCSLTGEVDLQIKYQERVVELWQSRADSCARRPFIYLYALINLLNLYCKAKQYDSFDKIFDQAKRIKLRDKKEAAAGSIALIDVKMLLMLNTAATPEILKFVASVKSEIASHSRFSISGSLVNLEYNLACVLFMTGEFKKAAKAFREISSMKGSLRLDLQGVSRLLLVLSEFDLNATEYVHSLNMAARRFYRKHEQLNKLDGLIFRMVDRLLSVSREEFDRVLTESLSELNTTSGYHPNSLGLIEAKLWVESRLNGVSIGVLWDGHRFHQT